MLFTNPTSPSLLLCLHYFHYRFPNALHKQMQRGGGGRKKWKQENSRQFSIALPYHKHYNRGRSQESKIYKSSYTPGCRASSKQIIFSRLLSKVDAEKCRMTNSSTRSKGWGSLPVLCLAPYQCRLSQDWVSCLWVHVHLSPAHETFPTALTHQRMLATDLLREHFFLLGCFN